MKTAQIEILQELIKTEDELQNTYNVVDVIKKYHETNSDPKDSIQKSLSFMRTNTKSNQFSQSQNSNDQKIPAFGSDSSQSQTPFKENKLKRNSNFLNMITEKAKIRKRNSELLQNLDYRQSIDINAQKATEKRESLLNSIKRNSILIEQTLQSPDKNFNVIPQFTNSSQLDEISGESSESDNDEQFETKPTLQIESALKINLIKLNKINLQEITNNQEIKKKDFQISDMDYNERILNLNLFKNQISNTLDEKEKVYKKLELQKLKMFPYHMFQQLGVINYKNYQQTLKYFDTQKNHNLIFGNIENNKYYNYYIKDDDQIKTVTIRNETVFAHDLIQNEKFKDHCEMNFKNNQIMIRDLQSVEGTYVKLNHNVPFVLNKNNFIMFNEVAGMLIKQQGSYSQLQITNQELYHTTDNPTHFIEICLIRKDESMKFFKEYRNIIVLCENDSHLKFGYKNEHLKDLLSKFDLQYQLYITFNNTIDKFILFTNTDNQIQQFNKFCSLSEDQNSIKGINFELNKNPDDFQGAYICISDLDVLQENFQSKWVQIANLSYVRYERKIFQVVKEDIQAFQI